MSARVYVLVGAKGGVGCTTIAMALGERLAAAGPLVLVDADLTGRRAYAVTLDVAAALDRAREPGSPASAPAHGRTLLELTRSYEDGFMLQPAAVEEEHGRVDGAARIIVDAPQPFAGAVRTFVTRAQRIVLVADPSLLGVAAARSMMHAMRRFGIPEDRILVVMNEARAQRELQRAEIDEVLRHRVALELPSRRERAWPKAIEQLARELEASPDYGPITALHTPPGALGDRRVRSRTTSETAPVRALPLVVASSPERERLKADVHATIMARVDYLTAARAHSEADKMAELRAQVEDIVATMLAERGASTGIDDLVKLRNEIVDEAVGLGPIESLLQEDDITEIMVNGAHNVYVERRGKIERTAKRFVDDRQVRLVIDRIIAPLGRRLDEASPMVDARLPDGSRVNAIVEPLAVDGPMLTIRRFGTRRLTMQDLIASDAVTPGTAEFLRAAVESRLNIVVSGGTGSGKTTLLNALSAFISRNERIITIEDAAELALDQPHVVRLESRPPNLEGSGAIAIRELVRNALRMRPDRIIVGEARGGEALDMLQAMNTGHDGSLTTIHANTPRDAMARIETMVLMSGYDLPVRAIREQTSSAVDIVVQVSRMRDGSRRMTSLTEVIGMEGDIVTMQELARFRQHGSDARGIVIGEWEATGVQPNCLKRFAEGGIDFDIRSLGATEERVWAVR